MIASTMKIEPLVASWQPQAAWLEGLALRDPATLHAAIIAIDDATPPVVARFTTLLSEEERLRAGRFRFDADRDRFIVAHAVLRLVAGRALGTTPNALALMPTPRGGLPPRLAPGIGDPPRLSLSHAGRFVAAALGWRHAVGIDVEQHRTLDDFAGLIRHALSADEAAALATFAADARQRIFLHWWTAKEAALKAQGIGFAVPPEEVALRCDAAGIPFAARVREGEGRRDYAIATFDPGGAADAIAALASAGHSRASLMQAQAADLLAWQETTAS